MQKSEPSAAISATQKGLPFKGRPFCVVGRVGKIENLIGALLGDISCAPATVWRRVNSGRTGITSCRRGAGTRKKSSSPSPLAQSDGNFPGWRSCPHTPRSGKKRSRGGHIHPPFGRTDRDARPRFGLSFRPAHPRLGRAELRGSVVLRFVPSGEIVVSDYSKSSRTTTGTFRTGHITFLCLFLAISA